jgi:hypothetical protein
MGAPPRPTRGDVGHRPGAGPLVTSQVTHAVVPLATGLIPSLARRCPSRPRSQQFDRFGRVRSGYVHSADQLLHRATRTTKGYVAVGDIGGAGHGSGALRIAAGSINGIRSARRRRAVARVVSALLLAATVMISASPAIARRRTCDAIRNTPDLYSGYVIAEFGGVTCRKAPCLREHALGSCGRPDHRQSLRIPGRPGTSASRR